MKGNRSGGWGRGGRGGGGGGGGWGSIANKFAEEEEKEINKDRTKKRNKLPHAQIDIT